MKKIIAIFVFAILFSPSCFVFANLEINEIMYDLKTGSDDEREWVEVYNNSNTPVDFSTFRFAEGKINSLTNHKLKLVQGDANIPAQGYALIVDDPIKFKADWPNFSGIVFDSSFSLNNDGETLALKDKDLNIIDQYTYSSNTGGAGDGNSLQKIAGVWQGAKPTPGEENKVIYVPPPILKSEPQVQAKVKAKSKIITQSTSSQPSSKGEITNFSFPLGENKEEVKSFANSSSFFILSLIFIIIIGGGAVYFIRRKKIVPGSGDDFEIFEE